MQQQQSIQIVTSTQLKNQTRDVLDMAQDPTQKVIITVFGNPKFEIKKYSEDTERNNKTNLDILQRIEAINIKSTTNNGLQHQKRVRS